MSRAVRPHCRAARAQRIRLASQIGSGLAGVLYVLDEPSIGSPPARQRPAAGDPQAGCATWAIQCIVVEHDEDAILSGRSWLIDIGPGGGQCTAARWSLRGRWKTVMQSLRVQPHRPVSDRPAARLLVPSRAGEAGNLEAGRSPGQRRTLPTTCGTSPRRSPSGTFTCITGVSGEAASRRSLIETHLQVPFRAGCHNGARAQAGRARLAFEGLEHLDKVIDIDQSPIGRTPRSNPATYTGAFTPIRDWFAGLPEAQRARLSSRAASPST